MIKCGDFSVWNGDIDWDRVKAAGLTHAVLKVIRRDFDPDKQFENNLLEKIKKLLTNT